MGLDTVELVMEAEQLFAVDVPDELAAKTETVGQFVKLIHELRMKADNPLAETEILFRLQRMISKKFAIPLERIVPEASFTKDLGLD